MQQQDTPPPLVRPEDAATLDRIADPFAGVFFVNKLALALLGVALVMMGIQGVCLYRLGRGTAAHVYEVHPDGKATYIGDREANLEPRDYEAKRVAKTFVTLLYAWNSSTIAVDIAEAVTMCNGSMGEQLRREFADAQFIAHIRESQVRSEITINDVRLIEHARRFSRVSVRATVSRYGLTQYDGAPFEQRDIAVEVVMSVVPREPELRPNGLEVVRLQQLEKITPLAKDKEGP